MKEMETVGRTESGQSQDVRHGATEQPPRNGEQRQARSVREQNLSGRMLWNQNSSLILRFL